MTEAQALEAIYGRWKTGWEALHSQVSTDPSYAPYVFDNESFDAVDRWARVSVINTTRIQTTSGPKGTCRVEQRGYIAIQLFGARGKGAGELATLADDVRKVFESEAITVGDQELAVFEGASDRPTTDGRWFMKLVRCGFLYTDFC